MAFELSKIVSWGRMHDEYVQMFDLSDEDLKKKILSCGDGPSGFNYGQKMRGHTAVSIDPIYKYSAGEIREQVLAARNEVLSQLRKNRDVFMWSRFKTPEELIDARVEAMEIFLKDYESGKEEKRYIDEGLPGLSFEDNTFDIAVCSHLLFTYSDHLDTDFHIDAVLEMLRVAKEVRVFPLLDLSGNPSDHINAVLDALRGRNFNPEIIHVPYEIQHGGNKMLNIVK